VGGKLHCRTPIPVRLNHLRLDKPPRPSIEQGIEHIQIARFPKR
jgi:hypothetical protein